MPRRNRRTADGWLQPGRKPKGRKRPRGWHRSAHSPGVDETVRFLFGDTAGPSLTTPPPDKEDTSFAA